MKPGLKLRATAYRRQISGVKKRWGFLTHMGLNMMMHAFRRSLENKQMDGEWHVAEVIRKLCRSFADKVLVLDQPIVLGGAFASLASYYRSELFGWSRILFGQELMLEYQRDRPQGCACVRGVHVRKIDYVEIGNEFVVDAAEFAQGHTDGVFPDEIQRCVTPWTLGAVEAITSAVKTRTNGGSQR